MSANDFPLSELANTMMREVFKAIVDSAMEQSEAYAELAASVGVPLDVYQGRAAGFTAAEQQATARQYVIDIICPLLSIAPPSSPAELPSAVAVDDAQRLLLIEHFLGVVASVALTKDPPEERTIDSAIAGASPSWSIGQDLLLQFTTAKMKLDAKRSYEKLRALLSAGMQRVVVTGGQLSTRVSMYASSPSAGANDSTSPGGAASGQGGAGSSLGLRVRLIDDAAALTRSVDLVSSVKIDFKTGTFPPLDLPK
ncbi:hypothetical protein WME76_24510 [Sorangium sp. So ce119]|uniref:hypothetical protein n=1 Tax=Sorangium sp. So ce119 TaxID=3133279 RepID=UPI003F6089EC